MIYRNNSAERKVIQLHQWNIKLVERNHTVTYPLLINLPRSALLLSKIPNYSKRETLESSGFSLLNNEFALKKTNHQKNPTSQNFCIILQKTSIICETALQPVIL